MKVLILNGPNLNLLGQREPGIYGTESFESYLKKMAGWYPELSFEYYQSNVEGEIINKLQDASNHNFEGIILNAGGYTHTSVAIADAIAAIQIPVIEVHISNIYARESFRQVSITARACIGVISGFGLDSYRIGVEALLARK